MHVQTHFAKANRIRNRLSASPRALPLITPPPYPPSPHPDLCNVCVLSNMSVSRKQMPFEPTQTLPDIQRSIGWGVGVQRMFKIVPVTWVRLIYRSKGRAQWDVNRTRVSEHLISNPRFDSGTSLMPETCFMMLQMSCGEGSFFQFISFSLFLKLSLVSAQGAFNGKRVLALHW